MKTLVKLGTAELLDPSTYDNAPQTALYMDDDCMPYMRITAKKGGGALDELYAEYSKHIHGRGADKSELDIKFFVTGFKPTDDEQLYVDLVLYGQLAIVHKNKEVVSSGVFISLADLQALAREYNRDYHLRAERDFLLQVIRNTQREILAQERKAGESQDNA